MQCHRVQSSIVHHKVNFLEWLCVCANDVYLDFQLGGCDWSILNVSDSERKLQALNLPLCLFHSSSFCFMILPHLPCRCCGPCGTSFSHFFPMSMFIFEVPTLDPPTSDFCVEGWFVDTPKLWLDCLNGRCCKIRPLFPFWLRVRKKKSETVCDAHARYSLLLSMRLFPDIFFILFAFCSFLTFYKHVNFQVMMHGVGWLTCRVVSL